MCFVHKLPVFRVRHCPRLSGGNSIDGPEGLFLQVPGMGRGLGQPEPGHCARKGP